MHPHVNQLRLDLGRPLIKISVGTPTVLIDVRGFTQVGAGGSSSKLGQGRFLQRPLLVTVQ